MSGSREKLRAVLLAFVMVTSVMAAGVAFTGTATADIATNGVTNAELTDVEANTDGVTQTFRADIDTASDTTTVTLDLDKDNTNTGDIVKSVDSATAVTDIGTGTDLTVSNLQDAGPNGEVKFDVSSSDGTGSTDGTVVVQYTLDTSVTGDFTSTTGPETAEVTAAGLTAVDVSYDVDANAEGPQLASAETLDEGNSGSSLLDGGSKTGTADNGEVDTVVLTFDKNIDDTTVETEDFLVGSIASGTTVSGVTTGDTRLEGGISGDDKIALEVPESALSGTGVTPAISYDLDGDTDRDLTTAGGGALSGDQDSGVASATDKAQPVYLRAEKTGTKAVSVVFSEPVNDKSDDGTPLNSNELSYVDQNGIDATSISSTSQSGSTVEITTNNEITSDDVSTDQVKLLNDVVADTNDNVPAVEPDTNTIQFSSAVQLSGPSNSDISTDIGGSQFERLKAGSAEQALGLIRIKDVSGDSPLAKRTLLEMPDGVTVDSDASDLFVTTTDGGISSTSASIENNGKRIRLDHTGSSQAQELIRLRGVVVNVAPDATASQSGSDNAITVDYATGSFGANLFKIERPKLLSNGQSGLIAGQTASQPLDNDIDIQTGDNLPNQIGNQTNIVIKANQSSGITFDSSIDPTKIPIDSGSGLVDGDKISISQSELTIPVSGNFTKDDSFGLDADDGSNPLKVKVAGDATSSDLTAQVETFNSTGPITLQSQTTNDFNVQKPGIAIDDGNDEDHAVIGKNNQEFAESANGGEGSADIQRLRIEAGTADIPANTRITISPNQSDVSFVNTDSNNALTKTDDLVLGGDDVDSVSVTSEGNLLIVNDGNVLDEDIFVEGDVGLDVGTEPADETNLGFTLSTNTGVSATTDDTRVVLERHNAVLNGGSNASFSVDADGEDGKVIADSGGTDAFSVVADNLDAPGTTAGSNITIELESGTGVTFDQSTDFDINQDAEADGGENNQIIDVEQSDDADHIDKAGFTSPTTIEVKLNDADQLTQQTSLDLDELHLNISGSASDTEISATIDTGDNEVTTVADDVIAIDSASPDNIRIDPDVSSGTGITGFSFGADQSTNAPTVAKSITGEVQVQNGGDFGGAKVNLEIVETPNESSGSSLNTTQVITAGDGTAGFNFTAGDTAGDYVVNATVDQTGAGVNVTYTAQPGKISDVEVNTVENALSGTGGDVFQAVVLVNATDKFGNLKQGGTTAQLTTSGTSTTNFQTADTLADDNTVGSAGGGLNTDTGDLSIDSDGSTAVLFESNNIGQTTVTVSKGQNSDTATVEFYDEVGAVDVSLNDTSVAVDDKVAANATLQTGDGTQIEVPDLSVDFDDNQGANTTFAAAPDTDSVETDGTGVATAIVTAEQTGSSTIDAVENLKSGSATLTIGASQADFELELVDGPTSVTAGENYTATVNVSNVGNAAGTQAVDYALEDANGDSAVSDSKDVSLNAGSSTEIEFNVSSSKTSSIATGDYTHVVSTSGAQDATLDVTIVAQSDAPADFTVSGLEAPSTVNVSDSVTVNATITNEGGQNGTQDVTFRLGSSTPLTDDDIVATQSVELESGASEDVSFTATAPSTNGTYTHGVFTANDSATATLDVTVEEDAPAYYTLKLSNSTADRAIQTTTISTFSTHRQSGSTALLPHSVYRYTRTHTGGLR